jgi:adenylate cyclase
VKPVDKAILTAAVEGCLNRLGRTGAGRSILVVDDDAAARELIGTVLTQNGYRVSNAADGAGARARVAANAPDLVILDLMLPDVSGFQLLAEWRDNPCTAELPVFVLTSKELTPEENKYILKSAGVLFHKQERWQEQLLRQVSRVVNPVEVVSR